MGEEQGWTDAVDGMRVGGRRRVYAKPREGEGPTARCDVEVRLGGRPLFDWLTGTSRLNRCDVEARLRTTAVTNQSAELTV